MVPDHNVYKTLVKIGFFHLLHHVLIQPAIKSYLIDVELDVEYHAMHLYSVLYFLNQRLYIVFPVIENLHP